MNIGSKIKWHSEQLIRKVITRFDLDVFHASLKAVGFDNGPTLADSGEEYFIKHVLPHIIHDNKAVFFDVGAHIGSYALILERSFENAALCCFEPNPRIFPKLKENIRGTHIKAFPSALGASVGKHTLFYSEEVTINDHSQLASANKDVFPLFYGVDTFETIECSADTVDNFCMKNNIDHIHFMKIDTEGNELDVIKGAGAMLAAGKIDVIQFEFNQTHILNRTFMRDFSDLLPEFDLFRICKKRLLYLEPKSRYNELFTYQNIVAIHKRLGYIQAS